MANVLAIGDLERALVRAGGWIAASVAASPAPTPSTFGLTGYDLTAGPSLAGALVVVGHLTRQVGVVQSITGSTVTLATGLATTPTVGDSVILYPTAVLPVSRVAFLANTAVAANTNVLTNNLAPAQEGRYRVRYLASAATTFSIVEVAGSSATTGAAATVVGTTQQGAALVAGAWYEVDFACGPHETYNFQVGTACNLTLRVQFLAD